MQSYTLQNQNHTKKKTHDLKISINYKIISFHFNSINQISFDSIEPNTHKIFSDFCYYIQGGNLFIEILFLFSFFVLYNTPFKKKRKSNLNEKEKHFSMKIKSNLFKTSKLRCQNQRSSDIKYSLEDNAACFPDQ